MNHEVQPWINPEGFKALHDRPLLRYLKNMSIAVHSHDYCDGLIDVANSQSIGHAQSPAAMHSHATGKIHFVHTSIRLSKETQPLYFTAVTHRAPATIDSRRGRFSTTTKFQETKTGKGGRQRPGSL